ncbi:ATP-binding protein [Pyrofollis japonicus]|uniref:ATP-binding protein n=1 Tax=Pyrofollis japonicus TaxID=3060460 RepID=UPI00295BFA36|nr:ATP-binding protein [Pyrofollis japonicus]
MDEEDIRENALRLVDEVVAERKELFSQYGERARLADEVAHAISSTGFIVGRVALTEDVGGDEIPVDIPPETWVRLAHENPSMLGEGYYYVVVDPKTLSLILASVSSTVKPSGTRVLGAQQPLVTVPLETLHPLSIAANVVSLRLMLRPLLLVHLGEHVKEIAEAARSRSDEAASIVAGIVEKLGYSAPTIPPDPNSPVIAPSPKVLEALLAPSREGVLVGGLGVMDSLYLADGKPVAIRLPWSVLVKHVLVTGTTGSGKTSLVKNMMLDASRHPGVHIVVLDASSDYVAGLLPGHIPGERVDPEAAAVLQLYGASAEQGKPVLHQGLRGIALIPCINCRNPSDYAEEATNYTNYLEETLRKSYEKQGCSLSLSEPSPTPAPLTYRVEAIVSCSGAEEKQELFIAPRKIIVESIDEVAQLDPYLTARAREALRMLVAKCGAKKLEELLGIIARPPEDCRNLVKRVIHAETLRNLESRLRALSELGVIGYMDEDPKWAQLDYTALAKIMEKLEARSLVLDLGYAAQTAASKTRAVDSQSTKVFLGYQLLKTLAEHMERTNIPSYALLVVDEAHLFFPPSRQEYAEILRISIEHLARLGRSRGISIIFSTHKETDVSPVITVLTNTKIYLRIDRRTAEETPLPQEYRRRLPYFKDHAAILSSYAVRGGYLAIKNAPPLIGHRTT